MKIIIYITCLINVQKSFATHPNAGLNILELAKAHNYPIEQHFVTTEDNYILSLYRIPSKKLSKSLNSNSNVNRPVVLMMHGLLSSSADWINLGPNKSLAYLLVDRGFDVWLGNARGNADSRRHKTLNPDIDKSFWSFSLHEIGNYDVPALIDYILEITTKKQLQYVGFSQGTLAFFVMTSSRPEYNSKIKLATLLGPAAYLHRTKNVHIKLLAENEQSFYEHLIRKGVNEIMPRNTLYNKLALKFCNVGNVTQIFCKFFIFEISGYDWEQFDGDVITVISTNAPAGCGVKQLVHFLQLMKNRGFKQFDYYSSLENLKRYNQSSPLEYDLSKVIAPVSMFYGGNDLLVHEIDAEETFNKISSRQKFKKFLPSFTHLDFLWAKDIVKLVYNDAIKLILEFEQ